jgi:hypothetical protein
MLKMTAVRLGAVAAVAAAGVAFGSLPAAADPGTPLPPLAGVGSDTTQDVVNGLGAGVAAIGSWDATGSATITTKPGGQQFNRPNGSGQGVYALSQSAQNGTFPLTVNGQTTQVNIGGQVDFARSSSGPSGTSGVLTYIPFAIDAVTYAVNVASDFPRDIPLGTAATDAPVNGLVPFNLRNIYRGAVTTFVTASGEDQTITPLVPQSGSGTRSFWLGQLGLVEPGSTSGVPHAATDRNGSVQEHNGTSITGAGDIVPFSVAQYIAQGNHAALPTNVAERRGQVALGKIGTRAPYVISNNTLTLNSAFPVKRTVYNVVQTSRLGEASIANTFVGSNSAVCQAGATIVKYGFATAPNCGVTTITGAYRATL